MSQSRKVPGHRRGPTAAVAAVLADERPYTARSVLASTLLGVDPPALPARLLVRVGELFGIPDGTARVAISRMTNAGELVADDGTYRLAGHLLQRGERQAVSRHALTRDWQGGWRVEVVTAEAPRSAAQRSDLRGAMSSLHLAEWREGVWLRPDNLPAGTDATAEAVVRSQCHRLDAVTAESPAELAAQLWDLTGWVERAGALAEAMADLLEPLARGDTSALPAGFVISAAVLRHFLADPLLPAELLPQDWSGGDLRARYDRYDTTFKATWRQAFRGNRQLPPAEGASGRAL